MTAEPRDRSVHKHAYILEDEREDVRFSLQSEGKEAFFRLLFDVMQVLVPKLARNIYGNYRASFYCASFCPKVQNMVQKSKNTHFSYVGTVVGDVF